MEKIVIANRYYCQLSNYGHPKIAKRATRNRKRSTFLNKRVSPISLAVSSPSRKLGFLDQRFRAVANFGVFG
jgi:hypothetical protein